MVCKLLILKYNLISLFEIMKLIRTRRELSTRDKLNIVWASYGSLTKFRNVE